NFVYGTGSQYWTDAGRAALLTAAGVLSSYIVVSSPVTINYNVVGQNSPGSGTLSSAWANFTSGNPGFYPTLVENKVLAGVDYNGGSADSQVTWNFAYPWALGDSVPNNQYDFKAVAVHELLHSLGLITGSGDIASVDRNWTTFDQFLTTADGTPVILPDFTVDPDYLANFTGASGGLYFSGPNAVAAYGGPVPVYTPSTWSNGSSVSHVDPNAPNGPYVMEPWSYYGPGVDGITAVELGMLADLGYTIDPQPRVVVLMFFGFGLLRRRSRG
ncbi:MAG: Ig-like domain-containing protein, partial [Mycobacterium sp.]